MKNLDSVGLTNNIIYAANLIINGRIARRTRGQTEQGLEDFEDAFSVLEVVKDETLYKGVEKAFSHRKDYRRNGYPKDAFHVAYIGHKTRLQNTLKQIGIDPLERSFREKRIETCPISQTIYTALQKKAIGNN